MDIAEAADQLNISVLGQTVTKHFLCYPKDCIMYKNCNLAAYGIYNKSNCRNA